MPTKAYTTPRIIIARNHGGRHDSLMRGLTHPIATAATRRADCNCDGPPPFAAASLDRASVNQVRAKVRNFPIFDFLNPLVQASSVHLPKLATKLKVLDHHIAFSFFKEVFGQTYVGSKTVHLR